MNRWGRHRVQAARVIDPFDLVISDLIDFDAAATRLQAAFRRLLTIINMPSQMIFDSIVGGWQIPSCTREPCMTHMNLGTLTKLGGG
jgi:hypothetical protein